MTSSGLVTSSFRSTTFPDSDIAIEAIREQIQLEMEKLTRDTVQVTIANIVRLSGQDILRTTGLPH